MRSSRVAEVLAELPPATRYQWLCSAAKRLLVGGAKPPSLPRLVPAERTRTATMSVSATIDSIVTSRSGELCPQPCDHLMGVRRALDRARLLLAEWLHRVLEVLLGHDVVGGTEIPGGEDLVEQPDDESLWPYDNPFLLYKEARYIADRMTLMS